ncbi:Methyltransferase domain-containing protein [Pseudobutyrivibrio sp. 49]|uniref:class I SAM-dependent methyltransferase n=1 Tax=Pseudobutyrivibrio sp. 49 TaxID=1855344 RepID=UPI000892030A|nr:class I SAM-dependent methyltransferase [Pseudobutyrivibrio sp. 49]SDI70698.1 Methyltransferase domain-containing protein [Pseudobutyrivibrio sp. 49]
MDRCGIVTDMNADLTKENKAYWLKRAAGYSEVNREELSGVQRKNWTSFLTKEIATAFPDREPADISIIDIGAGPGFLSIILAEAGYKVTAFDFAETMIEEAKANAGDLAKQIQFVQGDAMNLDFEDGSFDVIISRNLTWNLPDPAKAYQHWTRVLRSNGLMMVFDANWYRYLIDEDKKAAYDEDRQHVAEEGYGDYNIGDDFDKMEVIAGKMPLTAKLRPQWDLEYLTELQAGQVTVQEDVGQLVYSKKELVNYKSTPLFMVKLVRK